MIGDVARRDLRTLENLLDDIIARSPALLPAVQPVIRQAAQAVAAIRSLAPDGEYIVPLTEEQQARYFPDSRWESRQPSPVRLREASTEWQAAAERGRVYRRDALAAIGPVLAPGEVAKRLGVSTVTVNNWRRQGKLLALRFDGHQYVYPHFQFAETPAEGEHGVLHGLSSVLAALGERTDWEKAQYFVAPSPALGGQAPVEVLRSGGRGAAERVAKVAEHSGELGT